MFNDLYVVESNRCDEAEAYRLTYLTLHNLEVCRVGLVVVSLWF